MIIKSLEEAKKVFSDLSGKTFIFRGQTNADWELSPKIFRDIKTITNSARYELACFRPYLHAQNKFFKQHNSPIEHLINLQHYGGSTRLLDFSKDFLVSLFFACDDPSGFNINKNGKVFLIDTESFYTYHSRPTSLHYITEIRAEIERLRDVDRFYLVEPEIKNPRMKRQEGLFLMFPYCILPGYPADVPINFMDFITETNKLPSRNGSKINIWVAHMEIQADCKKVILDELNAEYGINSDSIYENESTDQSVIHNYESMVKDINLFYEKLLT